jgi:uncharacterized BrkB/YihY/UPF0761 family membrane protein
MSLPNTITMTRNDGHFWPAVIFRHVFTLVVLIPLVVLLVIAVINPLWFRDQFFRWVETSVYKITQWRNYRVYTIYLGTDPKVWHTLKGTHDNT